MKKERRKNNRYMKQAVLIKNKILQQKDKNQTLKKSKNLHGQKLLKKMRNHSKKKLTNY